MTNELIIKKSGREKHKKWLVAVLSMLIICFVFFFSSGMNELSSDIVNAYADTELYDNALEKIKASDAVIDLIGDIQRLDKLAILEGQVQYSNNHKNVETSIRIKGKKGKGMMDISAYRAVNKWVYTKINFRIKNPPEKRQTIEVLADH